jgi:hypothetical protein
MTLFYPGAKGSPAVYTAPPVWDGHGRLRHPWLYHQNVRGHRAWMMRGYAIGLGVGTQVLTLMAGEMIAGPPNKLSRALLMGAGWVINLAVAEWAIRRRPATLPGPGVDGGMEVVLGEAVVVKLKFNATRGYKLRFTLASIAGRPHQHSVRPGSPR